MTKEIILDDTPNPSFDHSPSSESVMWTAKHGMKRFRRMSREFADEDCEIDMPNVGEGQARLERRLERSDSILPSRNIQPPT